MSGVCSRCGSPAVAGAPACAVCGGAVQAAGAEHHDPPGQAQEHEDADHRRGRRWNPVTSGRSDPLGHGFLHLGSGVRQFRLSRRRWLNRRTVIICSHPALRLGWR